MNNKLEDCYFYFENDKPSDDECLKIMCLKCHKNSDGKKGWFWQGSIKGYGPYDFICDTCGTSIYKHNKESQT